MAAVSSMSNRRVPGAMPRSIERHFTVPSLLEERTATLKSQGPEGSLVGFESRLGISEGGSSLMGSGSMGPTSLNRGTYKTTNSTYGETHMSGSGPMETASFCQSACKETLSSGPTTIGRPITGRDAIELPPSKYPAPTSFPSFPASPTKVLASTLSSQSSSSFRTDQEGSTGVHASATKRYAQPKGTEFEKAMEQTLNGLAAPTKCNGYGQALSNRAKLTQPAVRGADACGLSSAAEESLRGTFRVKNIVEDRVNPGVSVNQAAYTNPAGPKIEDAKYQGTQTGYTSGFARNNPAAPRVLPSAVEARSQASVTIEDVHPSVARVIRVKDPVEHCSLVNPDVYTTTYKQTIDTTAKAVTRIQH